MATGHFITRLQLALDRDEHLDHFHHTRRQIIATANLFDLVFETGIQHALLRLVLLVQGFNLGGVFFVAQCQLPPLTFGQHVQQLFGDFRFGFHAFGAFYSHFAQNHAFQTRIGVAVQNGQFVVTVTGKAFNLFALDLQGAFVFFHTVAVKDAHLDNRAEIAGFDPQRCIANV